MSTETEINVPLALSAIRDKDGWWPCPWLQRQVDREFFLLLTVTDENLSWYNDVNFEGLQLGADPEEFHESNLMRGK